MAKERKRLCSKVWGQVEKNGVGVQGREMRGEKGASICWVLSARCYVNI